MITLVDEIDYSYIEGFLDGLRPVPMLTCSEWADTNRYLSSEASAEHGRWNTARTPYLRKVLDVLSPTSSYREIIVQKASQQGFSESGLNCIGTYMDISPCPIMYIMPTVNMAKGLSKTRLKPMIESCPSLNKKIRPSRERDADNTVLEKSYPGGILILTGANSAAELSSRPIRVLIMDEVDRYPLNVDNEGSPMALAKKRTLTFANRKIFVLSTPTVTGASAIEDAIEDTDKQYYFVNLPCCDGGPQTLKFEQLKWTEGKPESVFYECEHCGAEIDERHKVNFLKEKGYGGSAEWRATEPEKSNNLRIGFIINGLYSPLGWLSWSDIAKEYEESKDDPIKLRTFTNTVLGISFAEKSDAPPWENLYNKRMNYKLGEVHNDVCFLTAGVDVQKDRIEMEVVGWCPGKISYSIDYIVLHGDVSNAQVWKELSVYIDKQYVKQDGTLMPIRMTAVDSGNFTNTVYDFCRKYSVARLIPVKGQDTQSVIIKSPQPVDLRPDGKKAGKLRVFHIGVSILKLELYGWLRQEKIEDGTPDGYCHFPMYSPEYFRGITAERLEFKVVKGFKKYAWVKHYDRNEPLDCRVYARAAASHIGMDRLTPDMWVKLRSGYTQKVENKPVNPAENKPKSAQKRRNTDDFWG